MPPADSTLQAPDHGQERAPEDTRVLRLFICNASPSLPFFPHIHSFLDTYSTPPSNPTIPSNTGNHGPHTGDLLWGNVTVVWEDGRILVMSRARLTLVDGTAYLVLLEDDSAMSGTLLPTLRRPSEGEGARRAARHRRGLLHGVPGSEKGSLIHAIAGELMAPPFVSLSNVWVRDNVLMEFMGPVLKVFEAVWFGYLGGWKVVLGSSWGLGWSTNGW
ncbi:hypothetical protein B0H11DRAFT_2220353 [Mycena galericulata]|nr:hypothetical protein B0H11DRAFT_2220353 [Mycena galericulata]